MARLPSLDALRVFETASRSSSFTRAAARLHITPAAVSLRVRTLEAELGVALFSRNGPQLALTDAGRALASRLRPAFDEIAAAVDALRGAPPKIRLTAPPTTVAMRWLTGRLEAWPDISALAVEVDTSTGLADLRTFDIAVRTGQGDWAGLRRLASRPITGTPMVSPALWATRDSGAGPLGGLAVLRDGRWPAWGVIAGIDTTRLAQTPVDYPTQDLAAAAAVRGGGVALLAPDVYADLVRSGQLLRPFEATVSGPEAYHLLIHDDESRAEVLGLAAWLAADFLAPPTDAPE